jgi:hypothetical protein
LDQEDLAVYGSQRVGALVAEPLLRAVHHAFVTTPISQFSTITVDHVLTLARAFRDSCSPSIG